MELVTIAIIKISEPKIDEVNHTSPESSFSSVSLFLLRGMGNCFFTALLFIATISVLIKQLDGGRYLRPSDHGLAYQNTSYPAKQDMPEMLSFFNGGKTTPLEPATPLPEARNLSSSSHPASAWWSKNKKPRDGSGKNHARQILLLTSLICGLTGVVLLVVSASVLIYRYRKQRLEAQMAKQRPQASSSALVLALPSTVDKRDPK